MHIHFIWLIISKIMVVQHCPTGTFLWQKAPYCIVALDSRCNIQPIQPFLAIFYFSAVCDSPLWTILATDK